MTQKTMENALMQRKKGSREFQAGETWRRRKRRAQRHVGGVRERGLVGGREEWEEFTARSCVRGGAQGERGKETQQIAN